MRLFLESARAIRVVSNTRLTFIGTPRSELNDDGVYFVAGAAVVNSIACLTQLDAQSAGPHSQATPQEAKCLWQGWAVL